MAKRKNGDADFDALPSGAIANPSNNGDEQEEQTLPPGSENSDSTNTPEELSRWRRSTNYVGDHWRGLRPRTQKRIKGGAVLSVAALIAAGAIDASVKYGPAAWDSISTGYHSMFPEKVTLADFNNYMDKNDTALETILTSVKENKELFIKSTTENSIQFASLEEKIAGYHTPVKATPFEPTSTTLESIAPVTMVAVIDDAVQCYNIVDFTWKDEYKNCNEITFTLDAIDGKGFETALQRAGIPGEYITTDNIEQTRERSGFKYSDFIYVKKNVDGKAVWVRCPDKDKRSDYVPKGGKIKGHITLNPEPYATYTKDATGEWMVNTPETAEKNCPIEETYEKKKVDPPKQEPVTQNIPQPSIEDRSVRITHNYYGQDNLEFIDVHGRKKDFHPSPALPQCTIDQLNNWVAYNGQRANEASKQSDANVLKMRQGDKIIYHVNHGRGNFDMVVRDGNKAYFDRNANWKLDTEDIQYSLDRKFMAASGKKQEKWLFDGIYGKNRHVDIVDLTDSTPKDYAGLRTTLNKNAIEKLGSDCAFTVTPVVETPTTETPAIEPSIDAKLELSRWDETLWGYGLGYAGWFNDGESRDRSFLKGNLLFSKDSKEFIGYDDKGRKRFRMHDVDAQLSLGIGLESGDYDSYCCTNFGREFLISGAVAYTGDRVKDWGKPGHWLGAAGPDVQLTFANIRSSSGNSSYGYGPSYGYGSYNQQQNSNNYLYATGEIGVHGKLIHAKTSAGVLDDYSSIGPRLGIKGTMDRFSSGYNSNTEFQVDLTGGLIYENMNFHDDGGYSRFEVGLGLDKKIHGTAPTATKYTYSLPISYQTVNEDGNGWKFKVSPGLTKSVDGSKTVGVLVDVYRLNSTISTSCTDYDEAYKSANAGIDRSLEHKKCT